jgi:hypothetical protein
MRLPCSPSLRAVVIACLIVEAPAAHAQSTGASAEADALFDQGRAAMDAGRYAEACAAFDASQHQSPATSTLFNQANCREKNGQIATAYGLFREAERKTRARVDDEMERLNRVANARAKALEPRLSKLTILVAPEHQVPGLEVMRGELRLDAGAWNLPLPVDGGTIVIVARAPGYREWKSSIEVGGERDARAIAVPALGPQPEDPGANKLQHVVGIGPSRPRVVPIALASGAVVLLGSALGFELWGRADYDEAEAERDDARQTSLWRSARTKRYLAQGVAVAGVGCAGVAVWLWLRGERDQVDAPAPTGSRRAHVEPVAGAYTGLRVLGTF